MFQTRLERPCKRQSEPSIGEVGEKLALNGSHPQLGIWTNQVREVPEFLASILHERGTSRVAGRFYYSQLTIERYWHLELLPQCWQSDGNTLQAKKHRSDVV